MGFSAHWLRDAWAFRTVRKGLTWSWRTAFPPFKPFHQENSPLLQEFATSMLEAGAIEKTSSLKFRGSLFSVPKMNSAKRRIFLDLSTLNNRFIVRRSK